MADSTRPTAAISTQSTPSASRSIAGRVVWIDILRCVALMLVIVAHIAADGLPDVHGSQWWGCNFYNALSRLSVPVFVMISGAMFLGRITSMKRYLIRIVMSLLFWSVFYACFRTSTMMGGEGDYSPQWLLWLMVYDPNHLWFLYMIAGLYLITPLLRVIVRSPQATRWMLVLWGIFMIILPTAAYIPGVRTYLAPTLTNLSLEGVGVYSGYYVLGHMLYTLPHGSAYERLGLPMLIAGVCMTFMLLPTDVYLSGEYHFAFNRNCSFNICISSIGAFITFRRYFSDLRLPKWADTAINLTAVNSLGIYAIHIAFFYAIHRHVTHGSVGGADSWWVIPVYALVVAILSVAGTLLIRHIPWLRKII